MGFSETLGCVTLQARCTAVSQVARLVRAVPEPLSARIHFLFRKQTYAHCHAETIRRHA